MLKVGMPKGSRSMYRVQWLTGQPVITHIMCDNSTGYCLTEFDWIIDFLNWPFRRSVTQF